MVDRQQRDHATNANRNKRLLVDIQSTLRTPGDKPRQGSHASPRHESVMTTAASSTNADLLVDSIVERFDAVCLNEDNSSSQALDIRDAIARVVDFDEAQWLRLSRALLNCALTENNAHFAVDICNSLIVHAGFQTAIEGELRDACAQFILSGDKQKYRHFATFFAILLIADFPRKYSKAISKENKLLFILISAVKGWLIVIGEERHDSEDCPPDEETTRETAECCATAIAAVCATAKRRLWLKWPELTDEIYVAIKTALIGTAFSRETRKALLDVLLDMHMWPQQGRRSGACDADAGFSPRRRENAR